MLRETVTITSHADPALPLKPLDFSPLPGRQQQRAPHTPATTTLSRHRSWWARDERNGAGEGVRAGEVDERGAGAGVPGGGGRRVRGRQHQPPGQGAQGP